MPPLVEEAFFRGFLLKGIGISKIGSVGVVVLTSLASSVMHFEHGVYAVRAIVVGGLLFGFARARSGSVCPPIAMHTLQNIIATVEVVIYLRIIGNAA